MGCLFACFVIVVIPATYVVTGHFAAFYAARSDRELVCIVLAILGILAGGIHTWDVVYKRGPKLGADFIFRTPGEQLGRFIFFNIVLMPISVIVLRYLAYEANFASPSTSLFTLGIFFWFYCGASARDEDEGIVGRPLRRD